LTSAFIEALRARHRQARLASNIACAQECADRFGETLEQRLNALAARAGDSRPKDIDDMIVHALGEPVLELAA